MTGALVLVGTPLGNLGDLSPRAIEALRAADVVACEDTRRTGRLLAAAGIDKPSYVVVNEHTEFDAVPGLLGAVAGGATVALVSDAGMPGISDPGERVVRAVVEAGLRVDVVPGPTALATALVLSGLPAGRFCFEGFLPRKGRERAERVGTAARERRTTVLYEAPHRLARTLADLARACGGDRRVVLGRELTKLHEEVWRGTLDEAVAFVAGREPRGEYVVVLDAAPDEPVEVGDDDLRSALAEALRAGASTRDAAASVAAELGVPRRRAYALAVDLVR